MNDKGRIGKEKEKKKKEENTVLGQSTEDGGRSKERQLLIH